MKTIYLNRLLPLSIICLLCACQNKTSSISSSSSLSSINSSSIITTSSCSSSKGSSVVQKVYFELNAQPRGHFSIEQFNYLSNDDCSNTSPYNGNLSKSSPVPLCLSWECNVEGPYIVSIYKDEGLTDLAVSYETEDNRFDFYNPLFDQTYYLIVSLKNNESIKSEPLSFKEDLLVAGPRNLHIQGVENFRDIGGWGFLRNGQYQPFMKQGMLYRSGRFNEDKTAEVNATIEEEGLYEIKNHLKIKTEIDLRRTSTNEVGALTDKSVLGDDVNYYQLPMAYGGNNILTFKGTLSGDSYEYDNPRMIRNFFAILADENNYPINYHCSIGKDRTGCLSYLIEGLLGFNQEMMYRDYMFTNFANAGMCKMSDVTSRYGKTLDEYEQGTELQEKVYYYLNQEIGVTTAELDHIIEILKA